MALARRAACLALGTVIALGACSDSKLDAKKVAEDPCSLMDKKDVESIVGLAVKDGVVPQATPGKVVGESMCQFASSDPAKPGAFVRVGLIPPLPNYARAAFDKYKAEYQGAKPVPDLGSEALWEDQTRTLVVHDGDKVLSVTVFGLFDNSQERATQLAAKALGRL